ALVDGISSQGDTPLAVTRNREVIGVIRLKDVLKPGIREKILSVKVMGIRPVMLTGDQPLTAKSIAGEVGIDEYRPEAKPEDKYDTVTREQAGTRTEYRSPLSPHLQRSHHPSPNPTRYEGNSVQAHQHDGSLHQERAHLRSRRDHCALHRNQAHRHRTIIGRRIGSS